MEQPTAIKDTEQQISFQIQLEVVNNQLSFVRKIDNESKISLSRYGFEFVAAPLAVLAWN